MEYLDKIVAGGITLVTTALIWLVRTVFTNSRKIELLENEIKHRDNIQVELKNTMLRLESDVHKLSKDILDIWKK